MQKQSNWVERIFWLVILTSILFINISVDPIKGANVILFLIFIFALLVIVLYRMVFSLHLPKRNLRREFLILSASLIVILWAMVAVKRYDSLIYSLPLIIALLLALLLIFEPKGPIAILVVLSAFLLGEGFWRMHYLQTKVEFPRHLLNIYYLSVLIILAYFLYRREVELYKRINEANEKLRTLDTLKTDFIAFIAHELFTPLTSVKNAVDLLKRSRSGEHFADKNVDEVLEVISTNSIRQERLIKQLLELSKIEMKGFKLKRAFLNLAVVLQGVTSSLKTQLEARDIRLITNIPEVINIWGSPEQLEKIFANILENAIKYSPRDESIEISATDGKDTARVVISDRGPGIPDDKKLFIFERFARINYAGEYGREGMGLGLAIAKELVDMHKGEVRVEDRKGGGSNFVVELPKDLRKTDNA